MTFLFLELIICVVSRMTAVFGLSIITKLLTKKWAVSMYELAIVSMAGTIRGSVAFALILTIEKHDIAVSIIKSTTLLMVFITTIFLGAIMPNFITFCLKRDEKSRRQKNPLQEIQATQNLIEGDKQEDKYKKKKKPGFFKMFDEQYLKPFFIFDYVRRKPEIQEFKKLLKGNSPQYKGGQFVALMKTNARQSIVQQFLTGKEHEGPRNNGSQLTGSQQSNFVHDGRDSD